MPVEHQDLSKMVILLPLDLAMEHKVHHEKQDYLLSLSTYQFPF